MVAAKDKKSSYAAGIYKKNHCSTTLFFTTGQHTDNSDLLMETDLRLKADDRYLTEKVCLQFKKSAL
jgi:hypothetical protein